MKPGNEGHDSLSTIIRQAIGKEQLFPFTRFGGKERPFELQKSEAAEATFSSKENGNSKGTKSSPEQMQALRIPDAVLAFAQAASRVNGEPEKYLPGWPLLSPKVQLQKCEKCSREFCSMINYRRHILVHRRSLNIDKDFSRNREYLGTFWDKLSMDEVKELLSFTSMPIEEVDGTSIINLLTSWIRKPFFSSLPQVYVKAGSALLDMIQEKPANSPVSSEEFFSVLDNASEKTFLCTDTAVPVQKFVFDGEVAKVAAEMKNLISCVSFMLEKNLVKAWLADKDAEALRCHILLMEEEEATKRRQAELLERKRLKKLRQKEQKSKDIIEDKTRVSSLLLVEGKIDLPGLPTPDEPSRSESSFPELLENRDHHSPDPTGSRDQMHAGAKVADQNMYTQHSVPKSKRTVRSGFSGQVPAVKSSGTVRYGPYKDHKPTSPVSGQKIWTPKNKQEVSFDAMVKIHHQNDLAGVDSSEVKIGSISVPLGNDGRTTHQGKPVKPHARQNNSKSSAGMFWKPVGHPENADDTAAMSSDKGGDNTVVSFPEAVSNQGARNLALIDSADDVSKGLVEVQTSAGPVLFSSKAVEAFLTLRWEEAVAADHVTLVLTDTQTSDRSSRDDEAMPESISTARPGKGGTVGVASVNSPWSSSSASSHPSRSRTNSEKNCKLKYVPKQRNGDSGE